MITGERIGECAAHVNHVVNDRLQEMVEGHFQSYNRIPAQIWTNTICRLRERIGDEH